MTAAKATVPAISKKVNPEELVVDDPVVVVARFGSRTTTAVPPFWLSVVGVDRLTPSTIAETS
jgi:hypothetical protein